MDYHEFLKKKQYFTPDGGFLIDNKDMPSKLYPFQQDILRWALQKGKAALFADCGLGKTPMQLYWASEVSKYTNLPVLILAPLAVSYQTQREGEKFGVPVTIIRNDEDIQPGVNIAN